MTAPCCPVCFGTGDASGQGALDCTACSAATTRAALNAYVKSLGPVTQEDLLWLVHQRAVSQYVQDAQRWRKSLSQMAKNGCSTGQIGSMIDSIDAAIAQEKTK